MFPLLLVACALLGAALFAGCRPAPSGSVVNYETKNPIPNATVFHAGKATSTDAKGEFAVNHLEPGQPLLLRAAGFWPKRCEAPAQKQPRFELEPLETHGIYLSYAALGMPDTRARALQLLDGEHLNTLIVDIKDRQGRMTFYNGAPNAGQVGAFGAIKFNDMPGFLKQMHEKHIYVVGRLATFHDPLLAKHNPDWAVRAGSHPSNVWPDPYRKEVRDYMLAVIKEAAAAGFDEIELDCVWFPGDREFPDASYAEHDSPANRLSTILSFLSQAADILAPSNIGLSLAPEVVLRWQGPRQGKEMDRLTQAVQSFHAPLRNVQDLEKLKTVWGADMRQWRAYVEGGAPLGPDATAFRPEVTAVVKACHTAGLGGWVLCDSRNQCAWSKDAVRALAPNEL